MELIGHAITEMSKNSYLTPSIIIQLINCIKKSVTNVNPTTECGKIFKNQLIISMSSRFKDFEKKKNVDDCYYAIILLLF